METYDGDDFYCDVAIPRAASLDVVHDDDLVLAYHHTRPFWPVHLVVVPTNLGTYQDSRHLHVHVSSGTPLRP